MHFNFKEMKKLLFLFAFAVIVFSCKNEAKPANDEEALQEAVQNENEAALANFEYICNHCRIGDHQPGKCECGMEYEKNPNFVALVEEEVVETQPADTQEAHDHDAH